MKSISESGLEQPVTIDKDGLLLDGRNRLNCLLRGTAGSFV